MMYNRHNFFKNTYCIFTEVNVDENPFNYHYTSKSGSKYYFTDDGVYRTSNHWGRAAKCKWKLIDKLNSANRTKTGFAKWINFYSDNDWERLYYIDINDDFSHVQFCHKNEASKSHEVYLRTAAATTKRIREIRQLLKNQNWLEYYNEDQRRKILKKIIRTLINSDISMIEIRRNVLATLQEQL